MSTVVRRWVLAGLAMQLASAAACIRSPSFESEARRIGDALPRPVHFVRATGGYREYTAPGTVASERQAIMDSLTRTSHRVEQDRPVPGSGPMEVIVVDRGKSPRDRGRTVSVEPHANGVVIRVIVTASD